MKKIFSTVSVLIFCAANKAQEIKPALTFSGYAEIYYLYNFNNPPGHDQPSFIYSFNRCNETNLNLGFIKANYWSPKARANLALMTGTYAHANLSSEPEVLRNLYEGNLGVKLSGTKNLWLDAGIFSSHIGFESAVGKDCWNVTRSILAENSPYYESGVKLDYMTKDEKWYLAVMVLNGWQRIKRPDGNSTPAFGSQATYKPNANITINSGTFIGNDKPDSVRKMRYFHNFYSIFNLGKNWACTIGFDIGAEQKAKRSVAMNTWYSPVIIIKYSTNKFSIAARGEHYRDKKGVIIFTGTANGFQTTGISANADYAIDQNVLWRVEARMLWSKDKIFEKRNSSVADNCTWICSSLSINLK